MYGIFDIKTPGSTFDNDIRRDSSNNPNLTIFWEHSQDKYELKVTEGKIYIANGSGYIQRLLMKNRVK